MRRSLPYCSILTQEKAVRCFCDTMRFSVFRVCVPLFYIQSTLQIKLLVFLFAFSSTHYFTAVFCSKCGPGYVRLRTMLMITTTNSHTQPPPLDDEHHQTVFHPMRAHFVNHAIPSLHPILRVMRTMSLYEKRTIAAAIINHHQHPPAINLLGDEG